jgi:transcription-repair coupling factor (superfamily II helicase)
VPDDYVPEPELRLSLYTRLLRLRSLEEVEALRGEVEDRFGPLPEAVADLVTLARLRVGCRALGISRLSGGPQGLAADLHPDAPALLVPVADDLVRKDRRVLLRHGDDCPAARGRLAIGFLERLNDARQRG